MNRTCLITILLFIAPTARAQRAAPSADELEVPKGVEVRKLTSSQLKTFDNSESYTLVEAGVLQQLLRRHADARRPSEARIKRSEFSALLKNQSLQNGQLVLELETSDVPDNDLVSLGKTNLNNLRLFSEDVALTLATDSNSNLIPLIPPTSDRISGTWEASSTLVGNTTIFQLTLPASAVAVFRLRTDTDIQVSSSDALVVPAEKAERHTDWILYPGNPSTLTINCIKRDDTNEQGELNLAVATRARVDSYAATMEWEVGLPTTLGNSRVVFRLSEPCRVKGVRMGTSSKLDWSVNEQGDQLSVEVPEISTASTMIIRASIDRTTPEELRVPFLVPDSWRSKFGEAGGNTLLRSGLLRLTVSPELAVADLQLQGLLERDVSYSSDGFQTLELSQFSADATATAMLVPATPVVDDSVVMRPATGNGSGQVSAFIYVKARTGSLGRVQWQLPNTWQVTGVTEMASDLPLLFRAGEVDENSSVVEVDVFLRAPLNGESGQGIEIRLQSTERENTVTEGTIPLLENSQYRRRLDLVCFDSAEIPDALLNTEANTMSALTADSLREESSWLASSEFEAVTFFKRSDLENTFRRDEDRKHTYDAAIDYSVSEDANIVTESTRLRVRADQELPQQLALRVTSGADLRISEASNSSPPVELQKQTSGAVFDAWTLEIPAQALGNDLDLTLICQRALQDEMPATMVEIMDARQSGGTIRPPEGIFEIILSNTTPVMQSEPYPERPFDGNWMLYRSISNVSHLESSEVAFVILHQTKSGMTAEVMQRVVLRATGNRSVLSCRFSDQETPIVLVDGSPVFPDRDGAALQVPLSGRGGQSELVFLYRVEVASATGQMIDIPTVSCPEANSAVTMSYVLPPEKCEVDSSDAVFIRPVEEVTELLERTVATSLRSPDADSVRAFLARWKLHSLESRSVFCTHAGDSPNALNIGVSNSRFVWPHTILLSTVVCLCWLQLHRKRIISRWLPTLVLTAASVALLSTEWVGSPIFSGLIAGTIAFAIIRIPYFARQREGPKRGSQKSFALTHGTALLAAVAFSQMAFGQESSSSPAILLPATDNQPIPFAYVHNDFLSELQSIGAETGDGCYVVSSVVSIQMESSRSCVARIQCDVAVMPGKGGFLNIPLDGLTLVGCRVDGDAVYPERVPSRDAQLKISGDTILPDRPLDPQRNSTSSNGPATLGRWEIRSVDYSVRAVPRRSPQDYQLTIVYPPSSETTVEFQDTSGIIKEVGLPSSTDAAPMNVTRGKCRFPAMFNTQVVELSLKIRNPGQAAAEKTQQSDLLCVADISSTEQRLTCEYQVMPADARAEKVVVGIDPRYRITGVQSVDGDAIAWTTDGSNLAADLAPDANGLQRFIVRLKHDPPTGLVHQIPLGVLSQVNGIRTDSTQLVPRTSEQFVVSSVVAGDTPVEEIPVDTDGRTFQLTRDEDSILEIPGTAEIVSVSLAELQATRVARLFQKAVVLDDSIIWSCRCEVDVTGQPVFRQALSISPDVRINNVTASSNGVSRLKSWTRHGSQLVVSLPEETRGMLEIVVSGTIPRNSLQDATLPVVQLPPAIQITESDLEISSEAEVDTFIASLGAAVPVDLIEIESMALTATPITLSVGDESEPIVIRKSPEKKVQARFLVLLHEVGGENQYAQFLSLSTPDVAFDIRFRCPSAAFGSSDPIVFRNGEAKALATTGGDYVIPRIAAAPASDLLVAMPAVSVTVVNDELIVPIPNFDASVEVTECKAFDLRDQSNTATGESVLPKWVAGAAIYLDISKEPNPAVPTESRFDNESQSIVVRPGLSVSPPKITAETPGVLFAHGQHLLRFAADGNVAGNSGFLAFRSQAGSPLTIQVPEYHAVTDVIVNGHSQVFRVNDEVIELSPAGRIANVEVVWLYQTGQALGRTDYNLTLPNLIAAQSSQQAVIVPPASRNRWWKVLTEIAPVSALKSKRHEAISRGLALMEIDVSKADSSDSAADDELRLWSDFSTEAAETASVAEEFAAHLDDKLTQGALLVNLASSGEIAIASPTLPSPVAGVSLLSAVLLIVVPWWFRRPSPTPGSDSVVADQRTAITEPTIADSDILESDDSSSRSGFSQ